MDKQNTEFFKEFVPITRTDLGLTNDVEVIFSIEQICNNELSNKSLQLLESILEVYKTPMWKFELFRQTATWSDINRVTAVVRYRYVRVFTRISNYTISRDFSLEE